MNLSLAPLLTWLQAQGSWGYGLVAALPIGLYLLRQYVKAPAATPVPSPAPNAATNPASLAALSPLLNDALVALGSVPATGATINDVPHTTALQLSNDAAALVSAKTNAYAAALKDLAPVASQK